mmetsp:Transcript_24401/g.44114  ORF Transcript_24401/g.44114 Transcript_24401/m.44114 type:complete len:217 (-) Transcript_24401:878-1528(-)
MGRDEANGRRWRSNQGTRRRASEGTASAVDVVHPGEHHMTETRRMHSSSFHWTLDSQQQEARYLWLCAFRPIMPRLIPPEVGMQHAGIPFSDFGGRSKLSSCFGVVNVQAWLHQKNVSDTARRPERQLAQDPLPQGLNVCTRLGRVKQQCCDAMPGPSCIQVVASRYPRMLLAVDDSLLSPSVPHHSLSMQPPNLRVTRRCPAPPVQGHAMGTSQH